MNRLIPLALLWTLLMSGYTSAASGEIVAALSRDVANAAAASGWELAASPETKAKDDQSMAALGAFEAMNALKSAWTAGDGKTRWRVDDGRMIAEPGAGRGVVAAYTVKEGGFYAIRDSLLRRAEGEGRVELRVFVRRPGLAADAQPAPAVYTFIDGGEAFDFDSFLGYLDAGDSVCVRVGPAGDAKGDVTAIDFKVECTPMIPVSSFSKDAGDPTAVAAPGGWTIGGSAAAAERVQIKAGADSAVIFRVPQSGYYALHDASASAANAEARLYVGNESAPRRTVAIKDRAGLNADLGYVARGDVVRVVFSSASDTDLTFDATLIEWAPRRAPLRVRRGGNGYLRVYAPEAPHTAIEIAKERWITVPAVQGDATEAIRAAFVQAKALAADGWAGIRLERGAVYILASQLDGGTIFDLKDISRVVLDGNGATLRVSNPEFQRKGFSLFVTAGNANNLVFDDLVIEATHVPFTLGRIIDVNPRSGNAQTVTVEMEEGSPDPLKEIRRDGRAGAYIYDPLIPGRLGFGTWSHYPGAGDGPQIQTTDKPNVFKHALTRTVSSLNVGDKWLVKNKNAGLIYLTTRGSSNNITLSRVTGRASGGGTLRFWATSGINVLDSRFEPDDRYWISSSADGVHGRGREGVWIENTVIRGVCEDIMNTYGRTMALKPDDNPGDDTILLGGYENAVRQSKGQLRPIGEDDLRTGDRLVFFSPQTGKVLGYSDVLSRDGDRVKLSQKIDGVVPWTGNNPRELTMVYSVNSVGNFVVRDSKFMDSMRIGIYIKARGGMIFGNTIEGQSAPAIFAANEPEWPEGPPATHLWVQGNTFSQNNYGYMSRHRDFIVVDPAEISVYTRRFRDPSAPDDHRAFVSHGQHASSHVKIIGNTFHDWRGMGVSIRNARNVQVRDNLFLPPVQDTTLRQTLAADPSMGKDGSGRYAALFFSSVDGAQITGNRFVGLPEGDQQIVREEQVAGVVASDNRADPSDRRKPDVSLSFSEWFGNTSLGSDTKSTVELHGAKHAAGRLGAGLLFDGKDARATLRLSSDVGAQGWSQLSVTLWLRPEASSFTSTQIVYCHGDTQRGVVLAIADQRLIAGIWEAGKGAWIDLGPSVDDTWQHVALVFDGPAKSLRGYVNGAETQSATNSTPTRLTAIPTPATFGSTPAPIQLNGNPLDPKGHNYRGLIDEFNFFNRAITPDEVLWLALRRPMSMK